ncbi:MAG: hypothetical protein AB1513_07415 [Pseudomonadota bacterium]
MSVRTFLVGALLLVLGLPQAGLAGRILPPEAKRGVLQDVAYPMLKISGIAYRLAPGAKIFDQFNRITMPNSVPVPSNVVYTFDMNGDLAKVWLLTPEEQSLLESSAP